MNILTEEELKEIQTKFFRRIPHEVDNDKLLALISSVRNLLSANAELSFKLLKYENSDMSLHNENICSPEQLKRIKELM